MEGTREARAGRKPFMLTREPLMRPDQVAGERTRARCLRAKRARRTGQRSPTGRHLRAERATVHSQGPWVPAARWEDTPARLRYDNRHILSGPTGLRSYAASTRHSGMALLNSFELFS